MTIADRFALLVAWLRGEPVVTRYLAAGALTFAAKWGIDLDPLVVGPVLAAVATWAARRKVRPAYKTNGPDMAAVRELVDVAYRAGKAKKAKPTVQ